MEWFDQLSEVIVSWGHRYLFEVASSVVFLVFIHFVFYPMVLKRSVVATKAAAIAHIGATAEPTPRGTTTTITTGPITTNGTNSGVTVGVVPPPTEKESKSK